MSSQNTCQSHRSLAIRMAEAVFQAPNEKNSQVTGGKKPKRKPTDTLKQETKRGRKRN